jgi:hypothetical protein
MSTVVSIALMDIAAHLPVYLTDTTVFLQLNGMILPNKLGMLYNKERHIGRVRPLR